MSVSRILFFLSNTARVPQWRTTLRNRQIASPHAAATTTKELAKRQPPSASHKKLASATESICLQVGPSTCRGVVFSLSGIRHNALGSRACHTAAPVQAVAGLLSSAPARQRTQISGGSFRGRARRSGSSRRRISPPLAVLCSSVLGDVDSKRTSPCHGGVVEL